jgi:TonB family protein
MLVVSALKIFAMAALVPMPSDTPPARRVPPPAARELRAVDDVVLTARFANGARVPSTIVLPQIRNAAAVIDYIRSNYPDSPALPATIPVAWVYVDEEGRTHLPEVIVSSGSTAFDELALAAVKRAQFAAARIDTFKVAVWVMLPVQISGLAARPDESPRFREDTPSFTPYVIKPELRNRPEVQQALVRNYPPHLRDRRVSGTTLVWLLIDEIGRVVNAQVKESSGEPDLDKAALQVARAMLFTPAKNRESQPVKVWIQLPIVFRAY